MLEYRNGESEIMAVFKKAVVRNDLWGARAKRFGERPLYVHSKRLQCGTFLPNDRSSVRVLSAFQGDWSLSGNYDS